ncbi:MAG: DivIVA domain-containing protein [Acidimicrobiia bacterium]|nr:DivIVA domain-containing protein [Acidimicrobiia bacterium]
MSEESRPTPSFGSARRGYNRQDVDTYLREIQARLDELEKDRSILQARLTDFSEGAADVRGEIDAVGEDVDRILRAAEAAAEGMRSRASEESARWRAEADAKARETLAQAQAAAEHIRGDAWDTATEVLEQAKHLYRGVLQQSQQESLTLRAEAEREAHQLVSNARHNIEEETRKARMDSELMVAQARSETDKLIEAAKREAEAAQERAKVLEQRRTELMAELDTAQAAISQLDSDLEKRKTSLQAAGFDDSTVRVVPAEEPEKEWLDEERSVRLVSASEFGDSGPVDADDVVAEVAKLREESQRAELEPPAPEVLEVEPEEPELEVAEPVLVAAPEPVVEEVAPDPVVEPEPAVEPEPDPVVEPEPEPVVEHIALADDLNDLFTSLRGAGPPSSESSLNGSNSATAEGASAVAVVEPQTDWSVNPFDLRDRLLLPIANRSLRDVKRSIVDAQNQMLEELRTKPAEWEPDVALLESAFGDDLRQLAQESHVAGYAAAAELSGVDTTPHPDVEPEDPTPQVSNALGEELIEAMRKAREAEAGEREMAAAISKVFRTWRTDGAERWLRAASFSAYHDGLLWGLAELGVSKVRGVVNGSSCSECPGRVGERWTPGDSLPEGTGIPPIHVDCQCTLAPAD